MIWVVSSAVEHCLHTAGVTGSIPVPPTSSFLVNQRLRPPFGWPLYWWVGKRWERLLGTDDREPRRVGVLRPVSQLGARGCSCPRCFDSGATSTAPADAPSVCRGLGGKRAASSTACASMRPRRWASDDATAVSYEKSFFELQGGRGSEPRTTPEQRARLAEIRTLQ